MLLIRSQVQFPGQCSSSGYEFRRTVLLILSQGQSTGQCSSSSYELRRTVKLIKSPVHFPERQCCSSGHLFSSQQESVVYSVISWVHMTLLLIQSPFHSPVGQPAQPVVSSVPRRTVLLIRSTFPLLRGLIILKVWWGPVDPNQSHIFLSTKLIKMKLDFSLYKEQPSS